jgi:hypothetical protein
MQATNDNVSPLEIWRQDATHANLVKVQWETFKLGARVTVDGESLDLPRVAAVAKRRAKVALSDEEAVTKRIEASVRALNEELDKGSTVYGK